MPAMTIMVQGTASHVGKSVLVAALCRIFKQDGYRVAPFKSQNMALNSFVTRDGGEMGRAQVVQAEAAGLDPHVDMNPVLLKPTGQASSQVIVLGRPVGNKSAQDYHQKYAARVWDVICMALERLRQDYDVIVIEGAGSPAEVNLQSTEIVNMRVARLARAPVLLVADIDKGGALASVVGTLELISPEDRDRIGGIIINKFRGDVSLFQPAVDFLEERTGKQVLGIVPYFQGFRIQEEDTIPLDLHQPRQRHDQDGVEITVLYLPHISNFTDFDPLEDEPDVKLRYARLGESLGRPDLIIIPGSKNTIEDLVLLKQSGVAAEVKRLAADGVPVVGVCGGFQMLGRELRDPLGAESAVPRVAGLELLDIVTTFERDKITNQVEAQVLAGGFLGCDEGQDIRVQGYEIHMGRSETAPSMMPAFKILARSGQEVVQSDGAVSSNGMVMGTYIHGIFDSDLFRRHVIDRLRLRKGLSPYRSARVLTLWEQRQRDFDRLAAVVRGSLDMDRLYRLLNRC